jgi:hypothetical protein
MGLSTEGIRSPVVGDFNKILADFVICKKNFEGTEQCAFIDYGCPYVANPENFRNICSQQSVLRDCANEDNTKFLIRLARVN